MRAYPHLAAVPSGEDRAARPALPIRVVLADNHSVVRRSLRLLLDDQQDVEVVAEVADLSTVIQRVHQHSPHVLVLDPQTPSGPTLATLRSLRAQVPTTEIVVMTMDASPLLAQQALDAGAVGFVVKDHAESELLEAVRVAAQGVEFLSPRVTTRLHALRGAVTQDGLTPRETEILRLTALGHTSAEVAAKLGLSRSTVATNLRRTYKKLGLETRAELVRYALGRHLI